MTINSINNRADWYLATHKQGSKTFVGHGMTIWEAIMDITKQIRFQK